MKRLTNWFSVSLVLWMILCTAQAEAYGEDLFFGTINALLERSHNKSPRRSPHVVSKSEIIAVARRKARHHGLDSNLVLAVIQVESDFDPLAVSHKGARGLLQLMPSTARELGVRDPFDVNQNIDGGVRYLAWLIQEFDGDIPTALKAYNAGIGRIKRNRSQIPRETKRYVQKVARAYQKRSGKDLWE